MTAVKATVRKGRLELDELLDLPDGTELLVPVPDGSEPWDDRSDEPMPPEEIARVLALMDRADPLEMTDEDSNVQPTVIFNECASRSRIARNSF